MVNNTHVGLSNMEPMCHCISAIRHAQFAQKNFQYAFHPTTTTTTSTDKKATVYRARWYIQMVWILCKGAWRLWLTTNSHDDAVHETRLLKTLELFIYALKKTKLEWTQKEFLWTDDNVHWQHAIQFNFIFIKMPSRNMININLAFFCFHIQNIHINNTYCLIVLTTIFFLSFYIKLWLLCFIYQILYFVAKKS